MPITFSLVYTSYDEDNIIAIRKLKTQKNPITSEIKQYKYVGDLAGTLVKKLNEGINLEINGQKNSEIKNVLSTESQTSDEIENENLSGYVAVDNSGDDFFFVGNRLKNDSNSILSNINVKMVLMFTIMVIKNDLEKCLFDTDEFKENISVSVSKVVNNVRKYIKDFRSSITITKRNVIVDFYMKSNVPLGRMVFNIQYN